MSVFEILLLIIIVNIDLQTLEPVDWLSLKPVFISYHYGTLRLYILYLFQ